MNTVRRGFLVMRTDIGDKGTYEYSPSVTSQFSVEEKMKSGGWFARLLFDTLSTLTLLIW